MLTQDPVKIPEIPRKIGIMKKGDIEYVRYLTGRKYNAETKRTDSAWVMIGRKIESMPGLMYPNDNYEKYFPDGGESMEDNMTPEEEQFVYDYGIYGMYNPFFNGLYNEFRQQTRKNPDKQVNQYKAESINKVLKPLKDMMKGEAYADLLGLIETAEEGETGMTCSDVMILLTQYKSALAKYHKSHG